ncbi:nuclear-pore anchor-like isoform X2 [Gossypium australe]|uniref:Nuclear-pore anchor-like isoform X2 n=1 Tax=Gossypium australe TaxID=47621 RepID=A0A5B6VDU9_9ROSI|nr:nuclear-pore anchor-like isoform X2 [Gossypium australe]
MLETGREYTRRNLPKQRINTLWITYFSQARILFLLDWLISSDFVKPIFSNALPLFIRLKKQHSDHNHYQSIVRRLGQN